MLGPDTELGSRRRWGRGAVAEREPPTPEAEALAGQGDGRRVTGLQVAVGLVVVVGVVLRFATVSHLWLDEALSVNIARLPLARIPDALRHDGSPPLYYLVLHAWMRVVGTGTFAVRSLSGLFAVAALPLVWVAGRRIGGRRLAWAAVLLLAASPYAIRYATEVRMYSLVVVLVLAGWLALEDLLREFSWWSAVVLALATGLLLLSHYWAFYPVIVAGGAVAWRALRGPRQPEARRAALALAAGALLFVPWVPGFLYQLHYTGTPWGKGPGIRAVLDPVFYFSGGFGNPGFVLGVLSCLLVALAVFGRAVDGRRVEVDLRTRPETRGVALAAFGTVAVAVAAAMATRSPVADRYESVLFPFLLLLVAAGAAVLADPWVFRGVVALAVVLGLIAAAPNVLTDRTTAGRVARVIRAQARPGDVVGYCPDQLGPSVSRLLPPGLGVTQLTFPRADPPQRVNWVSYAADNAAARPATFAQLLLDRAGPDHVVWLVWSSGYPTFGAKCLSLVSLLADGRPDAKRMVTAQKEFEHASLMRFRPRAGQSPPAPGGGAPPAADAGLKSALRSSTQPG